MKRWVVAAFLPVLALAALAPAQEPMTNEDVVRALVAGRSLESVLEEIERRIPSFDISEQMIAEMRSAGVPEEAIRSLIRRQEAADAAARPEPEEEVPDDIPRLVVTLVKPASGEKERENGDRAPSAIVYPKQLSAESGEALGLADTLEAREITDVAVFLACLTPEHVPDHWRAKSPLGRDFFSMPRHRVLAFHPGAAEVTKKELPKKIARRLEPAILGGEGRFLKLELPDALEAVAAAHDAHRLLLGVAVRASDRYFMVSSAEKGEVVAIPEGARLHARIDCRAEVGLIRVEIAFLDPDRLGTGSAPDS